MQSKTGCFFASQFVMIKAKFDFISIAKIFDTFEKINFNSSVNLVSFPLITKQINLTFFKSFINFFILVLILLSSSGSPQNPGNSINLIF